MKRELYIALGARMTWVTAALSAVLVGHGFVLATDIYSASSRSSLASILQTREMDPLLAIVRPTLGGLDLTISLFVPLVAARVLSVEKERRTFGSLCLLEGSSERVVLKKLAAALCASAILFGAPITAFVSFGAVGAHLDLVETALAASGEVLHAMLVTAVSVAAAAWTRTLAQAAALGIVISLTSWAIDAAEGFAALAWLGGASAWSIERQLLPFQRGIVSIGSVFWIASASAGAVVLALIGARFGVSRTRRIAASMATIIVTGAAMFASATSRGGYDWSEQRRSSLPPGVVDALRALSQPIQMDVLLDRDDSRRRQLESDVLTKLYLARPDLVLRMLLDDERTVSEGRRDADYGRIRIRVGSSTRETRSTSRRELVTLIFETAGMPAPQWSQPTYTGYPFVAEGARRTVLLLLAYIVVPIVLLTMGIVFTRRRSIR